jgi:HSP20 family protein
MSQMARQMGDWSPAIDAYQRGNEFVIRAEVPGMQRQDLTVEVGDDEVTLHGERKREFEQDREGVFWTERSYGSFTRVIPLPPGVISDSAKATFNNGILEIVMQAPSPEERRGRRLDISGA